MTKLISDLAVMWDLRILKRVLYMMSLILPNKKHYPNMIFLRTKFTKHHLFHHQTPSPSFRFIRGKVANIDGEQKFVHQEDQTVVTVRPKSYTGSSGSVWASDQLKIKWEVPQLFEQPTTSTSMYALPMCA